MGLSTEEDLKTFKRVVFEYPKEHEKLKKEISRLDQEINDLMHILELGKLDSRSLKDIAEELQIATKKRREAKDKESQLRMTIPFISSLNVEENTINKLDGIIIRSAKLEADRKNRKYTARIRTDLDWMLNS